MSPMLYSFRTGKLKTEVYPDRKTLGVCATKVVGDRLKKLLDTKENVRMIFAAAPSQDEFLHELSSIAGIDWSRVTGFHMDEYVGLENGAEQLFGNFLKKRIFGKAGFKEVHYLNSNPGNLVEECDRYSSLLSVAPIDIVCLGIGENGHIAFNDPGVANFSDTALVKVVSLDDRSRQQQVNDGCFASIEEVPRQAITLTIPALMSGKFLCVVVPGPTKADAVYRTLNGAIDTECPATILRVHDDAVMFLDAQSAVKVLPETLKEGRR